MLKQRILVALIFLPVFVWLILRSNPVPFFILVLAGLLLAGWEFGRLVHHRGFPFQWMVVLPATLALGLTAAFPALWPPHWAAHLETIFWALFLAAFLLLGMAVVFSRNPETAFPGLAASLFATLMLGSTGCFVLLLRRLPQGGWWLILLFGFNWMYDAGALFAGMAFGRRPLAPAISPSKTVEGFVGGILLNVLAAGAFYLTGIPQSLGFSPLGFILLGVVLAVLAQAGDLVESVIKRWSGLKDSAGFIPGHGGVLDKIDSLFFTAPLLYGLVCLWLGS